MSNQHRQPLVSQSITNKGVIMPPRLRAALRAEREAATRIKVSVASRTLTIFHSGIEDTMDLVNAVIETYWLRYRSCPSSINLSAIHWLALGGRFVVVERYGQRIILQYGGAGTTYDVQCSA